MIKCAFFSIGQQRVTLISTYIAAFVGIFGGFVVVRQIFSQAGIQQIDKITPTPPMSFQTESMMPLDLGAPAPSSQVT